MSTSAQAIERFAPLTGERPASWERRMRALKKDGYQPLGAAGGGRGSAHLEALPLAYCILAVAGLQPSDGPDAVATLRGMPLRGARNTPTDAADALPTLEDQIVNWIVGIAAHLVRGKSPMDAGFEPIRSMRIALCLNPPNAIITIGDGPDQTTYVYAAGPELPLAMRRLTILSGDLFMAAGELLADTIQQHNAMECLQFLADTQPAKAAQKQKSADDLRQEVPAPFSDPPRANGTGGPNSLLDICEKKDFQGYDMAPAGHSLSTQWSD